MVASVSADISSPVKARGDQRLRKISEIGWSAVRELTVVMADPRESICRERMKNRCPVYRAGLRALRRVRIGKRVWRDRYKVNKLSPLHTREYAHGRRPGSQFEVGNFQLLLPRQQAGSK